MPPEVAVQEETGTMPEPAGGNIVDGTYDLVAEHEYRQFSISERYIRGAIRVSAGVTRAEHIYDPVQGSQADGESPHRIMTVSAAGPALNFEVTCPTGAAVFTPKYARGFTVQGTELWLFQEELIEIYTRRP
jgi:hypothetical protein